MPRFSGGVEADESKLMEDNADSQPSCSESVDDKVVPEMSHECSSSSLHSLANLSSALAINIKSSSKKVVVEETPAPCSSPSSSFTSEASWTVQVQKISNNSILNKRKLADKLNILALSREKSMPMDDDASSDEDDAAVEEAAGAGGTFCLLQTNKRGKSTVSDATRTSSNRAKFKNPLAVKKPR